MNEVTYTGDGETNTFYFVFSFFLSADVRVSVDGVDCALSDYTLIATANTDSDIPYSGGQITFTCAPKNNTEIKIWREIELTRSIDYQATAVLSTSSLNQDFNFSLEVLKDFRQNLTDFSDQYADLLTLPGFAELSDEVNNLLAEITAFRTEDWAAMVGYGMPDYANAVVVTLSTGYTAECNGWLSVYSTGNHSETGRLDISGCPVYYRSIQVEANPQTYARCVLPIAMGDVVTTVENLTECFFIPCKGEI